LIVNRSRLASILGISPTTLDRRVAEGLPAKERPNTDGPGEWQFDTCAVIDWLKLHDNRSTSTPRAEADLRYLVADVGIKELEVSERKKVLIAVEEIHEVVEDAFNIIRPILVNIPGGLIEALAAETDEARCRELLRQDVYRMLQEIIDIPVPEPPSALSNDPITRRLTNGAVTGMVVGSAELAEILGVAIKTIGRWVDKGMPVRSDGNDRKSRRERRFDTAAVIRWLVDGPADLTPAARLDAAKLRKQSASTTLKELELGERSGRLIDMEIPAEQINEQFAVLKSQLLAIPARLTHQVAATSEPDVVRRILVEELEDIASELTGFDLSRA